MAEAVHPAHPVVKQISHVARSEGQGEQDIDIWKECREEERSEPFENSFNVDLDSMDEDKLHMDLR